MRWGWLDCISLLCALPPAGICGGVLVKQDKKVSNVPAGQLLLGVFLMTCREEEKSGFHVRETHARDKKSK